jgi:hypothetical protein
LEGDLLPLIRNDDVSIDTELDEITRFCSLCDRYGFKIIHSIVPLGHTLGIDCNWNNNSIKDYAGSKLFPNNKEVYRYLLNRRDFFGTHGCWHTHRPPRDEQVLAKTLMDLWMLKPTYVVLPFNEESPEYSGEVLGMKVLGVMQRLEDFLDGMSLNTQMPSSPIIYCHSWRFKDDNTFGYSWEKLEKCLKRISMM